MQTTINGRTYNTETSLEISRYYNQKLGKDYLEEVVFKTKEGQYFLNYKGGESTIYSTYIAHLNKCIESEGIIELTEREAQSFIAKSVVEDEDFKTDFKNQVNKYIEDNNLNQLKNREIIYTFNDFEDKEILFGSAIFYELSDDGLSLYLQFSSFTLEDLDFENKHINLDLKGLSELEI